MEIFVAILLLAISTQIINLNRKITKLMSALDDKITALQQTVTAEEGVEDSAIALINGIGAEIQAAVQAALAQGATQAQLQALTDLGTSIQTKSQALAAAVAANQPPPQP